MNYWFLLEKVGIQELDWSSWHYKENFYKGDKIKGKPYDGAKFYYTRNKYNIVYHNGNQEDSKIECSFGADITNSGSYQPKTRPAGVESDYTFAGLVSGSRKDYSLILLQVRLCRQMILSFMQNGQHRPIL